MEKGTTAAGNEITHVHVACLCPLFLQM